MERVTVSLPSHARQSLRELARLENRPESELARELLLSALIEARRDRLAAQVEATMTPELQARLLALCAEMEAIRGEEG